MGRWTNHDDWVVRRDMVQFNTWLPRRERETFQRVAKDLGVSQRELLRSLIEGLGKAVPEGRSLDRAVRRDGISVLLKIEVREG